MSFSPFEIAELFARSEVEIRATLATVDDSDIAGVCRVRGVQVGESREETVNILIASKARDANVADSKSGPKKSGPPKKSGTKSLVQQGFLKQSKPKTSSSGSSSGSMTVDTKAYFAFSGFPKTADTIVICGLIREYVYDYLSEFSLEVIGWFADEHSAHVGVEYKVSETEALEAKIFEHRDRWMFNQEFLNTVSVTHPEAFHKPATPVPVPPPAPVASPLVSTPQRRLVKKVFDEVPRAPPPPSLPDIPALPAGDHGAPWKLVMESLGVMHKTMTDNFAKLVTQEHLEKYHQEQLSYVGTRIDQAVEPLQTEIQVLRARVEVLEGARHRSASEQPRATDPAYKRIVFTKIPESMSAIERIQAIEGFMRTHFEHVRLRDVGNFYKGRFPDQRTLTKVSYAEFSNSDVRREVLDKVGGLKGKPVVLKCVLGGTNVDIKPAKTELAMKRNSCLRKVADLLKEDARAKGKTVKIEWVGDRGVTVNGSYAFSQDKFEATGTFRTPFADLTVP